MNVLVGCEYSGAVRDAFTARGHYALSCDLLPSDAPSGDHYQGDIFDLLGDAWDLAIFFPPCTFLCVSGLHWNKRLPERAAKTEEALRFVEALLASPVKRIALENPVGCISTRVRKPTQIIQPYEFGDPESKATCLWLKNLPPSYQQTFSLCPSAGIGTTRHPADRTSSGLAPTAGSYEAKHIPALLTQWPSNGAI